MNKAQINLITGLGMIIMVIWSLINLWTYTQDMGMAAQIRNDINNAVLNAEKARSLMSQERNYAIDKALLLAGTTSSGGCGYMETWNTFPEIPTSNPEDPDFTEPYVAECGTGYTQHGDYCCEDGYDFEENENTCVKEQGTVGMQEIIQCPSGYGYDGTMCCKEGGDDCTCPPGEYMCTCPESISSGQECEDPVDPQITYGCPAGYYDVGDTCCEIGYSYDSETGMCEYEKEPLELCPSDYVEQGGYCCPPGYGYNKDNGYCMDVSENKIYYWKYNGQSCIPTWEEIGDKVEQYLKKVFGQINIENYNLERVNIVSEKNYEMDLKGVYWSAEFSHDFLEHDYVIHYYDDEGGTVEIFRKDGPKVLTSKVGRYESIEGNRFLLKGPKYYDISLSLRQDGGTYKCKEIEGKNYIFEGEYNEAEGDYDFFGAPADESCKKTQDSIALLLGGVVSLGQREFKVAIMNNMSGGFLSLESYDPLYFVISKENMYYVPEKKEWVAVDKKIGEFSSDEGKIVYDFIPSSNDKICYEVEGRSYNISNCLSLYTRNIYFGDFPDLYSYAVSFVEDEFEGTKGWMEYRIKDSLKKKDAVVNMKSLKVIEDGVAKAKNGWKIELINRFGLVGTQYFEDSLNEGGTSTRSDVWKKFTDEYCEEREISGKDVTFCRCSYGDEDKCINTIMNQSIIAEMKRIIEDSTYFLEAQTGYPWSIKIKHMDITVDELCSGDEEPYETEYTYDNEFDMGSEAQVIGIPMQILFGVKNGTSIQGDESWCEDQESGSVTKTCNIYTDEPCASGYYCTLKGYCCPPLNQDYIEIDGESHQCCNLSSITQDSQDLTLWHKQYKCIDSSNQEYIITEDFYAVRGGR